MGKAITERGRKEKYVVILPEELPSSLDADLRRAYSDVPKVRATWAASLEEAASDVFYSGFRNGKFARIIKGKLNDLGVKLGAEVHPIEFVTAGSGENPLSREEVGYFKACFLAQSIADARGDGEFAGDYLGEARAILDRVE